MSTPVPPKRRRHLMDPNDLRPMADDKSLTHVQRWVMSALAVTTILHLSVGLVIAAYAVDGLVTGERMVLIAIAGAFGVLAVASGLVIHKRSALSPWLLLGLVPAVAGIYWVLG